MRFLTGGKERIIATSPRAQEKILGRIGLIPIPTVKVRMKETSDISRVIPWSFVECSRVYFDLTDSHKIIIGGI